MEEEFKNIEEFNNKYSINNSGIVKNNLTNKIIIPHINNGYYRISTTINKKVISERIHRLVAKYFVINENPDEYKFVHHIDNNQLNNNYKNLQWCTNSYNVTEMLLRRHEENLENINFKKKVRECLKCKFKEKILDCIKNIGMV